MINAPHSFYQSFYQTLRHPAVRDLAWALTSTRLCESFAAPQPINSSWPQPSKALQNWLLAQDNNPNKLEQFLAPLESPLLGIYFENLWLFYLSESPFTRLICHHQAVRDQGKTLGELDFVYQCLNTGQVVHLEVAVKFYLGFSLGVPTSNQQLWYGPNCHDRLDLKYQRLVDHQCGLLSRPQAEGVCITWQIPADFQRQVCLAGRLFYPWQATMTAPQHSTADHLSGVWCRVDQLSRWLHDHAEGRYALLNKRDWLTPTLANPQLQPMPGPQLQQLLTEQLQDLSRPQMVARFGPGQLEPEQFCFVTPNSWPSQRIEKRR